MNRNHGAADPTSEYLSPRRAVTRRFSLKNDTVETPTTTFPRRGMVSMFPGNADGDGDALPSRTTTLKTLSTGYKEQTEGSSPKSDEFPLLSEKQPRSSDKARRKDRDIVTRSNVGKARRRSNDSEGVPSSAAKGACERVSSSSSVDRFEKERRKTASTSISPTRTRSGEGQRRSNRRTASSSPKKMTRTGAVRRKPKSSSPERNDRHLQHHASFSAFESSATTIERPQVERLHSSFSSSQDSTFRSRSPIRPLSSRGFNPSYYDNASFSSLRETAPQSSSLILDRPRVLRSSSRDTPSRRNLQPSPYSTQQASGSERSRTPDSDRPRVRTSSYGSSRSKSSSSGQDEHRLLVPREKSVDRSSRNPRPPISSSPSSSSLDDEPRTARRSRRPKPPESAVGAPDAVKDNEPRLTSMSPKKKGARRRKSAEYLNHSFNLSFSALMELPDSPVGERADAFDDKLRTPTIARKQVMTEVPNFGMPQSPMKQKRSPSNESFPCEEYMVLLEEEVSMASTIPGSPESELTLYEYAQRCDWDMVSKVCSENPWTAKYVSPDDGTTALHLAVMSRANPMLRDGALGECYQPASLSLLEQLIVACPEAAIIRCTAKRYTPLSYACLVADTGFDMDDSADMVRIILKQSPHSALVFTDDGFSALDVHIISYSRLHQEKEEVYSRTGRSSTVVLRTLLEENPSLALARSYGNRVRGPVELLYRCNLNEFKEASGEDIAVSGKSRSPTQKTSCSVVSTLSAWWAWKWALLLLKVSSLLEEDEADELRPFSAVYASAQLVCCPVPVLALAIDAFPDQVKTRNPRKGLHNCPLHEVCSWVTDDLFINGDPFVVKRKRKAIAMLLEAFPKAARMTNNLGETPLQLAIETCTPWDSLEALVRAFPKALTIPRNLEHCRDDSPLSKAVAYHNDDLGSVGSDEDEWASEAIDAVEGMYPFLVAGVLSHVPERRNHGPSFFVPDQDPVNHAKNLESKGLESLRSIFGLLRAKPEALALYIEDERNRRIEEEGESTEDDDESDEESCTIAFVEDADQAQYTEEEVSCENQSEYSEEELASCSGSSQYTEIEVQSNG